MKKAIELKNIYFFYEGYEEKVLDNVSFSVNFGEVALLSGFSGEGKSTVLSLIAGIIPNITPGRISGDVLIGGKSIAGRKMSEICRDVGIVLQNADAQIIQQVVEDEIAFGCENFAFPPQKIAERIAHSCNVLNLNPNWRTHTLSGGQKQRLITASTLATEQKIIVLDEPLANLDKQGAQYLMGSLRSLAESGYAVLVVEHRLDMVLPYVDSVWNISGGQVEKVSDKKQHLAMQAEFIFDTCVPHKENGDAFLAENISFSAEGHEIIKDVSVNIKKGARYLLLGENGSGKTTLMRLIARLSKPVSGRILQFVDAGLKQGAKGSKAWFKKVGVVYQNPNYQLFMPTVWEEVAFEAQSDEYAREIMQLFDIAHLAHRHPYSLSEGQKRKVSIAAVVSANPDVLLLDEPTVGQDYTGLRDMVRILNRLHEKSGNTIITITHDMRCAEALCDYAYVISGGKVAKRGGKEVVREYFSLDNTK